MLKAKIPEETNSREQLTFEQGNVVAIDGLTTLPVGEMFQTEHVSILPVLPTEALGRVVAGKGILRNQTIKNERYE